MKTSIFLHSLKILLRVLLFEREVIYLRRSKKKKKTSKNQR